MLIAEPATVRAGIVESGGADALLFRDTLRGCADVRELSPDVRPMAKGGSVGTGSERSGAFSIIWCGGTRSPAGAPGPRVVVF